MDKAFLSGMLVVLCLIHITQATRITSLHVIADSSSSVVVTWEKIDTDKVNTAIYANISYRQEYDDDQMWTSVDRVNINEGYKVINDLKYPYGLTCVRLTAYDVTGGLLDSPGQTCNRTFGEAPSSSPQGFTAYCKVLPNDHTLREATFRWQPVPVDCQNGVITGYQLTLRSKVTHNCNDECYASFILDSNTTRFHVPGGLSTRITYIASLVANNSYGESPPTLYQLQPIHTKPSSDRMNTLVFLALVILGILMGAWWAKQDQTSGQNRRNNTDLYKDSSAFRVNRTRRTGVVKNSHVNNNNNNNIVRV
ncbi:protein sidekick-2-like [Apostichopus japonicus]|uniref:protein sidekick-2-like n=1 Tax=Stichopus japonicus TaxID=307972 RepID=UPI003AB55EAB